jgi:hypothetical protein
MRQIKVTPVIDSIDAKTMAHTDWVQRVPAVGTFAWSMDFGWKNGEIKPGSTVTDAIECVAVCLGLGFVLFFAHTANQLTDNGRRSFCHPSRLLELH